MRKARRTVEMVMAALFLLCWNIPCFAAQSVFQEMLQDTAIGGLAGTLVSAAVMAFAKKPGNHLEYLGVGAGAGALVGAAYGAYKATRTTTPVAEIDKGKVTFAIPTIIPDFKETNSKGQTPVFFMAELVRGKF